MGRKNIENIENTKFFLVNLGCPKNLVDSENLASELIKIGMEPTQSPEKAKIIIVNTCGFIDEARKMSKEHINALSEFRKDGKKLFVIGCYPKRIGISKAKKILEADEVFGDIDEVIQKILETEKIQDTINEKKQISEIQNKNENRKKRINTLSPYSAYVKISEGCSRGCTFCSIPKIRGFLRSKDEKEIIDEVCQLASDGVREFILISQDTTMWGVDKGKRRNELFNLLDKISEIDGVKWIRLFYVYPDPFVIELIKYIERNEKIVRYIEIPFQHIDDEILTKMGRATRERTIKEIINTIKERVPDMAIRTEFIVGFPGETEEKFDKLVKFVQEYEPDWLGVFTFSPEPGTPSYRMWKENGVSKKIAKMRKKELMKIWTEILIRKQKAMVGKEFICIKEGDNRTARTQFQAPEIDGVVRLKNEKREKNNNHWKEKQKFPEKEENAFVKVKIIDFDYEDLIGEKIN